MRKLIAILCLLMLPCAVLADEQNMFGELPQEVLQFILDRWPSYELEDYLEHPDMAQEGYSFALVWANDTRYLLGFRIVDGVKVNWLVSSNAIPQTKRKASLYHYKKGTIINYIWDSKNEYAYVTQGINFGVSIPDSENETMESHVYYECDYKTTFQLKGYSDHFFEVDIVGDTFYFWDIGNGLRNVIDTDRWNAFNIDEVVFDELYKCAGEVQQSAINPPQIPVTYEDDGLHAERIDFKANQKHAVYIGPGKQYARAGNGKALVSTNDWIQVFGEHNGWLMIQYSVGKEQCRIGWIEGMGTKGRIGLDSLAFTGGGWYLLSKACSLTDDPLCSRRGLCSLPKGTQVEKLAMLGYRWMYVRAELDGQIWWGFLPAEHLEKM